MKNKFFRLGYSAYWQSEISKVSFPTTEKARILFNRGFAYAMLEDTKYFLYFLDKV